jgi:hypothetical protein
VPQDSKSIKEQRYLIPRLGDTSRLQQFIFRPAEDGGNALTSAAIADMFEVRNALRAVSVSVDGKDYRLATICWKPVRALPRRCPSGRAVPDVHSAADTWSHCTQVHRLICSCSMSTLRKQSEAY